MSPSALEPFGGPSMGVQPAGRYSFSGLSMTGATDTLLTPWAPLAPSPNRAVPALGKWIDPNAPSRIVHPNGFGWAYLNCQMQVSRSTATTYDGMRYRLNGVDQPYLDVNTYGTGDTTMGAEGVLLEYMNPEDYIEFVGIDSLGVSSAGLGYLTAIGLKPAFALTSGNGVRRQEVAIALSRVASQSIGASSDTNILWDTVTRAGVIQWSPNLPAEVPVPQTGMYIVYIRATWSVSNGTRRLITYSVNGNYGQYFQRHRAQSACSGAQTLLDTCYLRRGDTVRMVVHNSSASNFTGVLRLLRIG